MKKLRRALETACYAVTIVGLAVGLVPPLPVGAITSSGLDPAEFGNSASYTLSNTCNVVGATTMTVPVYFDQDPGNVTIRVTVTGSEGGAMKANGGVAISSGWKDVVITNVTSDSTTNMYRGTFSASLSSGGPSACGTPSQVSGTTISFRLNLISNDNGVSGGKIGYSSGNTEKFAVANESRCDLSPGDRTGCGKFYDYNLPFAPPCAQASGSASFTIYDADNTQLTGTSPENSQPKPFRVRVYDLTTGKYVTSNPVSTNKSSETDRYQYDNSSSGTDASGYFDNYTNMANSQSAVRSFSFTQGNKYQLRLTNVYTNNVLQFKLPFDSIYSEITCYSYNLKPVSSGAGTAIPGQTVSFGGSITNGGQDGIGIATNSKKPTAFSYLHMTYDNKTPAKSPPNALVSTGPTGSITCANYASLSGKTGTCAAGGSGSLANGIAANGTVSSSSGNFAGDSIDIPPDAAIGSKVCSILTVSPAVASVPGSIINNARASIPACVRVVLPPVSPEVQIWGYDARVGAKVSTSLTIQSGKVIGSWSEYGALSGQSNTNFASSRGLDGPNTGLTQDSWRNLTFANNNTGTTCTSSKFGCYGTISYPSSLVSALRDRCTSWATGTAASPHAINAATYSTTQFICVHGTAQIKGNIGIANATVSDPAKLPQVVIIADNIIIDPGVNNINAWLIAGTSATSGKISTCSLVHTGSGASINYFPGFNGINLGTSGTPTPVTCPTSLTVTGPVVTNKLYLYRTTNPGTSGAPAEVFNTRADAFLWAYGGGGASGTPYAQTTSVQELPPRF